MDKVLKEIPLGQSELLKEGQDLLIAFGSMVYPCLAVARKLEKEGMNLAVLNARFAKPLDEEMILRYAKPGRAIITAEEGVTVGGFGSAVRELLDKEKRFSLRFKSIGLPLDIYPIGKVDQIKKQYLLDEGGLVQQIREFYEEAR
jgi:1-deoxy-D-xylulose-5-phosphate synthase